MELPGARSGQCKSATLIDVSPRRGYTQIIIPPALSLQALCWPRLSVAFEIYRTIHSCYHFYSIPLYTHTMRQAIRSLRQSTPARGVRFNSSSSSPAPNPQVQKAVENAQKVLAQTSATVRRVAGPVGDKVGSALGGQSHTAHRTKKGDGADGGFRIQRTYCLQCESLFVACETSLSSGEDGFPDEFEHLGEGVCRGLLACC